MTTKLHVPEEHQDESDGSRFATWQHSNVLSIPHALQGDEVGWWVHAGNYRGTVWASRRKSVLVTTVG